MSGSGFNEPTTVGNVTTTSNVRQLSDGNGVGGGPGTQLGQGPTDKVGFWGATPVVQPSGAAEAADTRGAAAGSVMTFASSQSPSATATLTTAEKSITVQSGTAATLTPKSGDFFIVNKPTAQAGIGVGNIRYSAAGVVGLTISNFTAGTLTPTTSEIYGIVGVRGTSTVTTVLTPAAVTTSTTLEQIFTVPGIAAGSIVGVNKPSAQAGLDIAGVRVAGNNQVGVTFVNVTGGTLTPTAGETYTFFSSLGLDAIDNTFMLVANSTLTPATVATITTADVTLTSANVNADDVVIGAQKPTLQAGLGVVASRVSAANALKITYVNPTAGTLTPTASEDYQITMFRPNPVAPLVVYQQTLTPASVAANTTAEQTFTVTGVISGTPVLVNKPTSQVGLGIVGARVSTTNVIAITFCNATGTAITPNAELYTVGNFQIPIDTTAGNAVVQGVPGADPGSATLVNSLRSALVSTGFIAGA